MVYATCHSALSTFNSALLLLRVEQDHCVREASLSTQHFYLSTGYSVLCSSFWKRRKRWTASSAAGSAVTIRTRPPLSISLYLYSMAALRDAITSVPAGDGPWIAAGM